MALASMSGSTWKSNLAPCTPEEELLLYHRFLGNKLILSPGKSCMCKEPLHLNVAMHGLSQALVAQQQDPLLKDAAEGCRGSGEAAEGRTEDVSGQPRPSSSGQSHAQGAPDISVHSRRLQYRPAAVTEQRGAPPEMGSPDPVATLRLSICHFRKLHTLLFFAGHFVV